MARDRYKRDRRFAELVDTIYKHLIQFDKLHPGYFQPHELDDACELAVDKLRFVHSPRIEKVFEEDKKKSKTRKALPGEPPVEDYMYEP